MYPGLRQQFDLADVKLRGSVPGCLDARRLGLCQNRHRGGGRAVLNPSLCPRGWRDALEHPAGMGLSQTRLPALFPCPQRLLGCRILCQR